MLVTHFQLMLFFWTHFPSIFFWYNLGWRSHTHLSKLLLMQLSSTVPRKQIRQKVTLIHSIDIFSWDRSYKQIFSKLFWIFCDFHESNPTIFCDSKQAWHSYKIQQFWWSGHVSGVSGEKSPRKFNSEAVHSRSIYYTMGECE